MSRVSNRDKILTEGMKVVHQHGFGGASVRDIVQAAGVPQGSFTNHFASKEAFGLEVIDLYFANSREVIRRTLLNEDLPPVQRLHAYIDANKDHIRQDGMRNGCLFGNFTAEATDSSDVIRLRLVEIFAEVQASVATCLKAAQDIGEISASLDCDVMANFLVSSLQGSILLAKAQRDIEPVENFESMLFSTILR